MVMRDSFGDFMISQAVKKDNEVAQLRERIRTLESALVEAKELIKIWHGYKDTDDDTEMWRIYNTQSPEMKRINAALDGKPVEQLEGAIKHG